MVAVMSAMPTSPHAEVVVDLGAIRHNVGRLRELVSQTPESAEVAPPQLMVVVKADAYGHGMVPVARAARQAGADWLGVVTAEEALALRASGDTGPVLCWLAAPGADHRPVLEADIDLAAYNQAQLEEIRQDAISVGRTARVHLKVDTGLSRGGIAPDLWLETMIAAREAERTGVIEVVGLWSHLAASDDPEHPANDAQVEAFERACELAAECGLDIRLRHLANSAGALLHPRMRYDLVRFGISTYGFSPAPTVVTAEELGLVPAMRVHGRVIQTREVPEGTGVSYGHTFVTDRPMRLALVPMGYADGVPRHASSRAEVLIGGRRSPILGRVCMDQFVVEGPESDAGDDVVLFGAGTDGEPTAQDWADWCDTISYEIVTRMGGRQRRVWLHEEDV